jgi:hypothetical protein
MTTIVVDVKYNIIHQNFYSLTFVQIFIVVLFIKKLRPWGRWLWGWWLVVSVGEGSGEGSGEGNSGVGGRENGGDSGGDDSGFGNDCGKNASKDDNGK